MQKLSPTIQEKFDKTATIDQIKTIARKMASTRIVVDSKKVVKVSFADMPKGVAFRNHLEHQHPRSIVVTRTIKGKLRYDIVSREALLDVHPDIK
jgi:hypothetical protein